MVVEITAIAEVHHRLVRQKVRTTAATIVTAAIVATIVTLI